MSQLAKELSVTKSKTQTARISHILIGAAVVNAMLITWLTFSKFGFLPEPQFLGAFQTLVYSTENLVAVCIIFLSSPFSVYLPAFLKITKMSDLKFNSSYWPSPTAAKICLGALAVQWFTRTKFYWSDAKIDLEFEALFYGLLFPLSAALGYYFASKHFSKESFSVRQRGRSIASRLTELFCQTYPYLSLYAGFLCFVALLSFLPGGIGSGVSAWLLASMADANIGIYDPVAHASFSLTCSALSFVSIAAVLTPLMIKLSAGYQSFLKNLLSNNVGDDFMTALASTLNARVLKLSMQARHLHLRALFESMGYLLFCFLLLFVFVAIIPFHEPAGNASIYVLGRAIRNWLDCSLIDANLDAMQHDDGLRYFLAVFVAFCSLTPFAVSFCVFLPRRKNPELYVSEQGMLLPSAFGRKLSFWSELRSVSVSNQQRQNEALVFDFRHRKITLETRQIEPEKLSELLAFADEFGAGTFEPSAIALRAKLSRESNTSSLAEAKKFESTIFSPYLPGKMLYEGTCRIIRKISSKPVSAVYLARLDDGRKVVLKQYVCPNKNQKSEEQMKVFMREYQTLERLSYPDLAKVLSCFEEDGSFFIILEHIEGKNLREIVESKGARKESLVLSWAIDVCRQLEYLHSQDPPVLHRDLSPDNLMLDQRGRVRIIDFGAAHQFMEGVTGTLIGKQSYMAPEQIRGKASTRSDIYSLAASLYFLLSGKDPKALQESDLSQCQLSVSAELSSLIKRSTSFEEMDRPASASELLAELLAIKLPNKKARAAGSPAPHQVLPKAVTEAMPQAGSEEFTGFGSQPAELTDSGSIVSIREAEKVSALLAGAREKEAGV